MALQGLRETAASVAVQPTEAVDVAVEAMNLLGLVEDTDRLRESVVAEFGQLAVDSGKAGEFYVQLPVSVATLADHVAALDTSAFKSDYPKTFVWDELWTPGTHRDGYTEEELYSTQQPHVRLAVHGTENPGEPLLHFLNMPFDRKYAQEGQQTQQTALTEAQTAYEAEYPDFTMQALNALGIAFIALQRRITGESMPLTWGFMRDATLPRKSLDGRSVVGGVNSVGSQLYLFRSVGHAISGSGVGLSVGPREV